jgi:hypothetical protein
MSQVDCLFSKFTRTGLINVGGGGGDFSLRIEHIDQRVCYRRSPTDMLVPTEVLYIMHSIAFG